MRSSQAGWKSNAFPAFSSFGCVSSLVPRRRLGHFTSSLHRRLLCRDLALAKQSRSVLTRCDLWRRRQARRDLHLLALLEALLVLARLVASRHLCTNLCTLRFDILLRDLAETKQRCTVLPGCDRGLCKRGNVLMPSALCYVNKPSSGLPRSVRHRSPTTRGGPFTVRNLHRANRRLAHDAGDDFMTEASEDHCQI